MFAIGLVLYEMLTGRPAVSGISIFDVLRRIEQFDAAEDEAAVALLMQLVRAAPMEEAPAAAALREVIDIVLSRGDAQAASADRLYHNAPVLTVPQFLL